MIDLSAFTELVALDHGLCVVSTLRRDGSVHATVVNAGVLHHPRTQAAVEGTAEIMGPDDPHADVDGGALRPLLQDIFRSAGGAHDDWDTFDRVMVEERRAAVLITPRRAYTNPQGG